MSRSPLFIFALFCAWACLASAAPVPPVEHPLPDPAQEARARQVFADLRCVVCEGQSIADSPSAVAADIRAAVRQMITEGKTNDEIKAFLVSRYGEVVLMMPKVSARNWLLWMGPMMIGLMGICVVLAYFGASQIQRR